MYRSSHSTSPHDRFLDQFEWEGGDWLYRYKMTGPAYRVADAEKDAFVAAFDRAQKYFLWLVLTLIVIVPVIVFVTTSNHSPPPDSLMSGILRYSGGLGVLIGFALRFGIDHFTFRAPQRLIDERVPVAPPLSKAARRELALERANGGELFAVGLLMIAILSFCIFFGWPTRLADQLLMLAFVCFFVWVLVQSTRKWLLARRDHTANNLT